MGVVFCSKDIEKVVYSGYTIDKIYACGGDLVYSASTTPPTPPTGNKLIVTYLDSSENIVECNSDSALLASETKPSGYDYTTMTDAVIGDCVTVIGSNAFNQCSGLTSVTIPSSVTETMVNAFMYTKALTSVTIPDSVTSIGNNGFYCGGLTSITIPNSVTSIGDSVFYQCTNLVSATIGSGLTSIGSMAFYYCRNLTSVTIPSSVTRIGNYAFMGCRGITSMTFEGTTPPTLGTDVFDKQVTSYPIYVPASAVNVYKSARGWTDVASRIQAIP